MKAAVTKMPPMNLEPECARAFLEHCLRLIWKRKADDRTYLKNLFISKRFLSASQQFPISNLVTVFCFKKMCLGFLPIEMFDGKLCITPDYMREHFMSVITYRSTYNLLALLKPTHFYIILNNPTWPITIVKKCTRLFNLVHGKIGLSLDKKTARSAHLILNHLSAREIGLLRCTPEILTNPRLTSPLTLDSCDIDGYVTNVQLTDILRHNFKFLSLKLDDEFIDETSRSEMSSMNSSVSYNCASLTQLYVECDDWSESFMKLLDFVKDRCPNLQRIILKIEWTSHKWNSGVFAMTNNTDSIVARFLEIQHKIQEIMVKCKAPINKLQIDSNASMLYYGASEEFNCNWVEEVKKLDLFKDAVHQDSANEKICRLDVKSNDYFLDLCITSQVHYGPQKSSQLTD